MATASDEGHGLYSISQVNALTGVSTPTLRKWEGAFRDYLRVIRTGGGQRRFHEDAVRKIELLKQLIYEEGLSLQGARKRLEALEEQAAPRPAAPQNADESIDKLSRMVTEMLIEKLFRHGISAPAAGYSLDRAARGGS